MSRNFGHLGRVSFLTLCLLAGLLMGLSESHASSVDATLKREQFLGRLRIELRKNLCDEGGLTDCFAVSRSSCEEFVTRQFDGCVKKFKTGGRVSLIGEDAVIAEDASQCLSERFSRKYKTKFKESNECKIRQNL